MLHDWLAIPKLMRWLGTSVKKCPNFSNKLLTTLVVLCKSSTQLGQLARFFKGELCASFTQYNSSCKQVACDNFRSVCPFLKTLLRGNKTYFPGSNTQKYFASLVWLYCHANMYRPYTSSIQMLVYDKWFAQFWETHASGNMARKLWFAYN